MIISFLIYFIIIIIIIIIILCTHLVLACTGHLFFYVVFLCCIAHCLCAVHCFCFMCPC
jgi:hypothetical protein